MSKAGTLCLIIVVGGLLVGAMNWAIFTSVCAEHDMHTLVRWLMRAGCQ